LLVAICIDQSTGKQPGNISPSKNNLDRIDGYWSAVIAIVHAVFQNNCSKISFYQEIFYLWSFDHGIPFIDSFPAFSFV
jgi:hypothetical protein